MLEVQKEEHIVLVPSGVTDVAYVVAYLFDFLFSRGLLSEKDIENVLSVYTFIHPLDFARGSLVEHLRDYYVFMDDRGGGYIVLNYILLPILEKNAPKGYVLGKLESEYGLIYGYFKH